MYYSYILTTVLTFIAMIAACRYTYVNKPEATGFFARWTPFASMVVATVLLMLSPIKNVVVADVFAHYRRYGYSKELAQVLDIITTPLLGTRALQVYTFLAYCLMLLSIIVLWRGRRVDQSLVEDPEACTS